MGIWGVILHKKKKIKKKSSLKNENSVLYLPSCRSKPVWGII